jgi:hypothetical protein
MNDLLASWDSRRGVGRLDECVNPMGEGRRHVCRVFIAQLHAPGRLNLEKDFGDAASLVTH